MPNRKTQATRQLGRRREIERALREFLDHADKHPKHLFAAGTRKFLEEVRPIVEQLDVIEVHTGKP